MTARRSDRFRTAERSGTRGRVKREIVPKAEASLAYSRGRGVPCGGVMEFSGIKGGAESLIPDSFGISSYGVATWLTIPADIPAPSAR